MKKIFLIILIIAFSLPSNAELVPSGSTYSAWDTAGVVGGIPAQTQTIHTTINTTGDTTDRTAAINTAITAAAAAASSGNPQVVKLGAGTFRILGKVIINATSDYVILRGSGQGSTTLDFRGTGTPLSVGDAGAGWPYLVAGTALSGNEAAGQTVISLDSTASFSVGDHVKFSQDRDTSLPVMGVSNTGSYQYLISKVTDKDSSTITIYDELPHAFTTALNAQVRNIEDINWTVGSGVEDLTLDCENGTVNGYQTVEFFNVDSCWFHNVKINMGLKYLIYIIHGYHVTVAKCYFNDQNGVLTSDQAGLAFGNVNTAPGGFFSLFYDNIFVRGFPHLEINGGSSGNVFAYNVMIDSVVDGQGNAFGVSVDTNHGPHPNYNLYEGNVFPKYQSDAYFGSASHDTALRNRITGTMGPEGLMGTSDVAAAIAVSLGRFTRYYNIVGNILGMPQSYWTTESATLKKEITGVDELGPSIYQFGYPNMGNHTYSGTAEVSTSDNWDDWDAGVTTSNYKERDLDVENTTTLKGNYNTYDGAVPESESIGGDTVPDSYYLASKPDWFYGLTWPPFDPTDPVIDLTDSYEAIPAGYRFLNDGADPE